MHFNKSLWFIQKCLHELMHMIFVFCKLRSSLDDNLHGTSHIAYEFCILWSGLDDNLHCTSHHIWFHCIFNTQILYYYRGWPRFPRRIKTRPEFQTAWRVFTFTVWNIRMPWLTFHYFFIFLLQGLPENVPCV